MAETIHVLGSLGEFVGAIAVVGYARLPFGRGWLLSRSRYIRIDGRGILGSTKGTATSR